MHTGSDWVVAVKQAETVKPAESVQPNQAEEKIDLDEIEEEIEEVKEIEEVAEEEEKVVEEEETGEMIEQNVIADGADTCSNVDIDTKEAETRAALLAYPPHGSEICINGISSDISKEDLEIFCGSVGQVTRVNICKRRDPSKNVCEAFVEYKSNELAAKAVQELNDTILKESSAHHNWGYAFVEYYNYACANHSRSKISDPNFKLSNGLTAIWASKERKLLVRNLPNNVTQDQLRSLFEHHGEITEVALPPAKFGQVYRIGFVEFAEPSSARRALSEKYHLDGQVLTCTFAKLKFEKRDATEPNTQEGPLLQNIPCQMGYGNMAGAYGAPGYALEYSVRAGAYSAPRYVPGYAPEYGVRGDAYSALGYAGGYGGRGDAFNASGHVPRYGMRGVAYSAPEYGAYIAPRYVSEYGVRGGAYGVSGYGVRGGAFSALEYAPGYGVMGGAYSGPGYAMMGSAYSAPGLDVMGGAYGVPGPIFAQPILYRSYGASGTSMVPTFLSYGPFPYSLW